MRHARRTPRLAPRAVLQTHVTMSFEREFDGEVTTKLAITPEGTGTFESARNDMARLRFAAPGTTHDCSYDPEWSDGTYITPDQLKLDEQLENNPALIFVIGVVVVSVVTECAAAVMWHRNHPCCAGDCCAGRPPEQTETGFQLRDTSQLGGGGHGLQQLGPVASANPVYASPPMATNYGQANYGQVHMKNGLQS